jgi:hypothetical protein
MVTAGLFLSSIDQIAPYATAVIFTDWRPSLPGNDASIQPQVFTCMRVYLLGQRVNTILQIVTPTEEMFFILMQSLTAQVLRWTVDQTAFAAAISAQVIVTVLRDIYPLPPPPGLIF